MVGGAVVGGAVVGGAVVGGSVVVSGGAVVVVTAAAATSSRAVSIVGDWPRPHAAVATAHATTNTRNRRRRDITGVRVREISSRSADTAKNVPAGLEVQASPRGFVVAFFVELVVFLREAPRGVIGARFGATLRTRLNDDFRRSLERTRFFEAPMASLFHGLAPTRQSADSGVHLTTRPPVRARPGFRHLACLPMAGGTDAPTPSGGDTFDVAAMIDRFRARARAVRSRSVPPVEGPERRQFLEQMQVDYMDFAMLADAQGSIDDGVLTLRVDLRPPGSSSS